MCFTVGCLGHLFDSKRHVFSAWCGHVWSKVLLASQGIRVHVEHRDRLTSVEPRMVVANHTSYLDPPAIGIAIPPRQVPRFIMKRELLWLPFVGWYCLLTGHFLIDRGSSREGIRLLERAADRARRLRLSPVLFPEGTRSRDGTLQTLRPGSFALAIQARMPVQPIGILGPYDLMPKGAGAPYRSGVIRVIVGEPLPIEPYLGAGGRKALAAAVRERLIALGVPG